jgi:hypothetical protein
MKTLRLKAILLLLPLVLSGCLSRPKTERSLPGAPESPGTTQGPAPSPVQIEDYEGKADGEAIPEWVSRYFAGGDWEVEGMAEYRGKYVFVGENRGANFDALSQWQAAFSPVQDFVQLAASRIESRLINGAAGAFPDNVYGPFFETMVKQAYDAKYQGVEKERGFWVRLPPEIPPVGEGEDEEPEDIEGENAERISYVFLVLLSIDRSRFESQVNEIFASAKARISLTRSQEAAVNRIRENFFVD